MGKKYRRKKKEARILIGLSHYWIRVRWSYHRQDISRRCYICL